METQRAGGGFFGVSELTLGSGPSTGRVRSGPVFSLVIGLGPVQFCGTVGSFGSRCMIQNVTPNVIIVRLLLVNF